MTEPPSRLRIPPRTRFSNRERVFDLDEAFERLPDESVERGGHMQKTLYRYGPATTAIFALDEGAELEYRVEGEAILHVIRGLLRVTTDVESHQLTERQLILLDPNVPQRLRALAPTKLLMTLICDDEDE